MTSDRSTPDDGAVPHHGEAGGAPLAGPGEPEIRVVADPPAGARAVAGILAVALAASGQRLGVTHLATTGGSTAPALYRALLAPDLRGRVPWDRLEIWFGDDRFVPPGDPDSNVTPLEVILRGGDQAAGLPGAPLPASAVHPIPVSHARAVGGGPGVAAAAYAREIRRRLRRGPHGLPEFDAIVLGVGPDGHCLSVFPGSAVFDADPADLVLAVPAPTHVEPHLPRVTLHPDLVTEARIVVVAAFGIGKADVLAEILDGPRDERRLPAQVARRAGAIWVLDEPAAARLRARS